jgi:hypothetical protein
VAHSGLLHAHTSHTAAHASANPEAKPLLRHHVSAEHRRRPHASRKAGGPSCLTHTYGPWGQRSVHPDQGAHAGGSPNQTHRAPGTLVLGPPS